MLTSKYFIQFAKGDTSMSELSEITSEIIKANKFDLFSDMFGKSDVNSYDATKIGNIDIYILYFIIRSAVRLPSGSFTATI